jgi:hypothetical protein
MKHMYFFYVHTTLELLLERVHKPTVCVATCGRMAIEVLLPSNPPHYHL